MPEEPPSNSDKQSGSTRSWLERVFSGFGSEPKSREELLAVIQCAADNKVVDQEALSIMKERLM